MNIGVQIWMGLIPAAVLLAGYIWFERRHVIPVLCAVFFITGGGQLCLWTFRQMELRAMDTSWQAEREAEMKRGTERGAGTEAVEAGVGAAGKNRTGGSSEDNYLLVNALIAEGETEAAAELLRDTVKQYGYEPEAALARARIYGRNQDFAAALTLYKKADKEGISDEVWGEEYAAVKSAASGTNFDRMLLREFPEYEEIYEETYGEAEGVVEVASGERYGEEVSERIASCLREQGREEEPLLWRAAESIAGIEQSYAQFLQGNSFETDAVRRDKETLQKVKERYPLLADEEMLRGSVIKAAVLNSEFETVTEGLSRDSSSPELLIASQLYLNGYVDDKDFPDAYVERDKTKLNAVRQQLKELKQSLSGEAGERAELLEKRYKRFASEGALCQLEQDLLERSAGTGEDSSKIYLQLARMELEQDNEEEAGKYLAQAFRTASASEDWDYADSMNQVIGLIGKKDDAEGLKELAYYAQNALDHQLDVALPGDDGTFGQFVSDTAIQNRVSVSISRIDASAFPTVTAEFQFEDGRIEDIRDKIVVEDCGVTISEYQIEKIRYDSARMLLCCDVSGSMAGKPIEDLKAAIRSISAAGTGEISIALVAFHSDAFGVLPFTEDGNAVKAAAESLSAGGGTSVYNGVMTSLGMFPDAAGNNMNYIVVLSDGQSGDGKTLEEVTAEIQAEAERKGILVHSLGLGDGVDANYLEALARAAGGTYAYVSNSETLDAFYKGLQTRMNASYRITYEATDTLTANRSLRISAKEEEYRYDEKEYDLPGAVSSGGGHQLVFSQNQTIRGLDTRFLFRGSLDAKVNLLGEGFAADDSISVEMKGDRSYTLAAEYVDGTTYRLTIPAQAACGTYDIYIRLNGKQAVLAKELVVAAAGSERLVEFGPYKFTAYQRVQNENSVSLDGYVTLNSWLHFKGKVLLTGNPSGEVLTLQESSGSYIQYRNGASLGLARLMLRNNEVLPVPSLGKLNLYRDDFHGADSDEYRVEYGVLPFLYPAGLLKLSTPGYALYPYKIKLDFNQFTTEFPGQKKIFKTVTDSLFQFDVKKAEGILTGDNIGLKLEVSANEAAKTYHPCQLGSWNLNIQPSGKVKINTLDNEYGFDLGIKMLFFDGDGISIGANWHGLEKLTPYDFKVKCSKGFTKTISGVPVTFKDFFLGAEKLDLDQLSATTWLGGFTASVADIGALSPKLKKYVGDNRAAASLEEVTLKGNWEECFLKLTAKLKLLGGLDCGSLLFEVGRLTYTNLLLNMKGIDAEGLHARAEVGPDWSEANCRVKLRVAADLALTNRVMGLGGDGVCDIWFKWWIPEFFFNAEGNVFAGFYTDHDGEFLFTVRGRGGTGSVKRNDFDLSLKLGN